MKRTNIHHKLLQQRGKKVDGEQLLQQVKDFLEQDTLKDNRIIDCLDGESNSNNILDFDKLSSERIFHENDIKNVCITYRLRFLETRYFKGKFPQEVLSEIKQLEQAHNTQLSGFKIIAPSKLFRLEKADDPVLFVPMGNRYYYMVHKWGNDLHPLRKWMMWPFKSLENLIFAILLSSVVATMLVPDGLFTKHQDFSQDIMVFFFMFKSIAAIVLFYGFALGKNFNTAIWQSRYDKAQ
ncbi:MAG: hypothetical protein CL868_04190 [Cytophagaceae bacterium]|nr:hypothetical protein [Cytophagaceae bacterium]|tara:strand:- start:994 stop:1707 length:714 start_codon:yes stop_codon:yes gene_type:complete